MCAPFRARFPQPLRLSAWLFGLALLTGCAGTGERPQPPQINPPEQFTTRIEAGAGDQPWWQLAADASLQAGLQNLLNDNPQIRIDARAVAASRARMNLAEAERWPELNASAAAGADRNDGDDSDSRSLGLDASLPLDVFGRLAATRDAAAFDLAGDLAQLEQTRLEQVQAFLLAKIDDAEAAALSALIEQQVDTAKTLLKLTELRFAQGLVSSVDVLQQREQLASLKQQLPAATLQRRLANNQLDALLGRAPRLQLPPAPSLPLVSKGFATASPARLLERRPDLIAQRAALAARDQRYEAALRARLPEASLSASALLRSVSGDTASLLGIAAQASVAVFDSGRLQAGIDEQAALLEQAGSQYLQSWLSAVRETDDLANRVNSGEQQVALSQQASRAAEDLFAAARRRYERGVSDYLPVINALRSLQTQQRSHLALLAEQQRLIVRLHTAMGLPRGQAAEHTGERP